MNQMYLLLQPLGQQMKNSINKLVALTLVLTAPCFAQAFSARSHSLTVTPDDIVTADFNNDGRNEVVVVSRSADALYIYGVDFSGLDEMDSRLFPTDYGPSALCVGDFNGDHYPDIAVGARGIGGNYISTYLGDEDYILSGSYTRDTDGQVNAISSGDFNGDGYSDVVVSTGTDPFLTCYRGDEFGLSSSSYTIAVPYTPQAMVCGYFDDDEYMDLVIAPGGLSSNNVYLINGSSSGLGAFSPITGTGFGVCDIDIGLYNDDIYADLLVTCRLDSTIKVYEGSSSGDFSLENEIEIAFAPKYSKFLDFNADSLSDIAVTSLYYDTIMIYEQTTGGSFGLSEEIPVGDNPCELTSISGFGIYRDILFNICQTSNEIYSVSEDLSFSSVDIITVSIPSFNNPSNPLVAPAESDLYGIVRTIDHSGDPIPYAKISLDGNDYYTNIAGFGILPLGYYPDTYTGSKSLLFDFSPYSIPNENKTLYLNIIRSLGKTKIECYFGGTLGLYGGTPNSSPIDASVHASVNGGIGASLAFIHEEPGAHIIGRRVKAGLHGDIGIGPQAPFDIVDLEIGVGASGDWSWGWKEEFSFEPLSSMSQEQMIAELGLFLESALVAGSSTAPGVGLYVAVLIEAIARWADPFGTFTNATYKKSSTFDFLGSAGFGIGIKPSTGQRYSIGLLDVHFDVHTHDENQELTGEGFYIPSDERSFERKHSFMVGGGSGVDLFKLGFRRRWYRSGSRAFKTSLGSIYSASGAMNIGFTRKWENLSDTEPHTISLDLESDVAGGILITDTHLITRSSFEFPSDIISTEDNVLRDIVTEIESSDGVTLDPASLYEENLFELIDLAGTVALSDCPTYPKISSSIEASAGLIFSPSVDVPLVALGGVTVGFTVEAIMSHEISGEELYFLASSAYLAEPLAVKTICRSNPSDPSAYEFITHLSSLCNELATGLHDIFEGLWDGFWETVDDVTGAIVETGSDIVNGAGEIIVDTGDAIVDGIVGIGSYVPTVDFGFRRLPYTTRAFARPTTRGPMDLMSETHNIVGVGKAYEVYYLTPDSIKQDMFIDSVEFRDFIPDSAIRLAGFDPSIRDRIRIYHWTQLPVPDSLGGGEAGGMVELNCEWEGDTLTTQIIETGVYIAGISDTVPDITPPAIMGYSPLYGDTITISEDELVFSIDVADTGSFASGLKENSMNLIIDGDSAGASFNWRIDSLSFSKPIAIMNISNHPSLDSITGSCNLVLSISDNAGNRTDFPLSFYVDSDTSVIENTDTARVVWPNFDHVVYPNPASDWVRVFLAPVKAGGKQNTKIEIYDITGRKLQEKEVYPTKSGDYDVIISLDNLPLGLFLIKINQDGHTTTSKVMHVR